MTATRCPCGTGETYPQCCGPLHDRTRRADTAEQLMRSRFSAFVIGHVDHLLTSWHPSTRPESLTLDRSTTWTRLEILQVSAGGSFDRHGLVEFRAHHRTDGAPRSLHELSSFVREDGSWFYVAGMVT